MKKIFDFSRFDGIKTASLELEKNKDKDSYKVIVIGDDKEIMCFNHVPSQYIKEDQVKDEDKKELNEEASKNLVRHRINIFLTQLRQCVFTSLIYGIKLNGNIESYDKDEVETDSVETIKKGKKSVPISEL